MALLPSFTDNFKYQGENKHSRMALDTTAQGEANRVPAGRAHQLPQMDGIHTAKSFAAGGGETIDHLGNSLEKRVDIISDVLAFCSRKSFLFFACVSKSWYDVWRATDRSNETGVRLAAATQARTEWVLGDDLFQLTARRLEGDVLCPIAKAGNLGGLQAATRRRGRMWTREKGGRRVMELAASGGHLEMLQRAKAEGCPWDREVCMYVCMSAAKSGYLELMQWAVRQECPWDELVCCIAAYGGHLDMLKWARAQGCPWNKYTCSGAATRGHLDVLRWARGQGCPWDELVCMFASRGGHLAMLQWARQQGCPWDEVTCCAAAFKGHLLEVLQWARAQGCPWHKENCILQAAEGRHHDVVRWIEAAGTV